MDDVKWVCDEHLLPMGGASEKKRATEKEKTWKKRSMKDEKL